jgi:hypothetical protein
LLKEAVSLDSEQLGSFSHSTCPILCSKDTTVEEERDSNDLF